ncbi:hypothetical protein [Metabacillus litoralis]|uniref:hypothetical protein n=1 Tax=Metabacillus litoralis TaxID=152268 RepID=UPI001CFE81AA|nr:hypothetical protein [Metabacillus litoralis]
MGKKAHIFNVIAGIIIIGSAIDALLNGSNNLPYFFIFLFVVFYLLQFLHNKSFRFFGLSLTALLLFVSIMTSLPRIFPFAP